MSNLRTQGFLENPEILDTTAPFSNFDFIEKRFGSCTPLQRIFSIARMAEFSTLVVEQLKSVGYSEEDDENFVEFGISPIKQNLIRLTFFKRIFSKISEIELQSDFDYLGYVILKVVPNLAGGTKWIIFESVVKSSRHINNFYHVGKQYDVKCGNKIFKIKGTIYCQQNGVTSVCAHVALRTAIATTSNYADINYKQMNDILKRKGLPHQAQARGLKESQIKVILDELKIKYSIYASANGSIPFQKFIYGCIESGFPALLGFYAGGSMGHVIPVLGHTFNEDTWVPNAETSYFKVGKNIRYVPSEIWVSTYICHDDNFGPHFCLPRQYLSAKDNVIVIGFEPDESKYDAVTAEVVAIDYLNKIVQHFPSPPLNPWLRRLKDAVLVKKGWVVSRPLFMSGADYLKHLRAVKGWENDTIKAELLETFSTLLTGYYWVIEISLPELFPANKRKLGEVVLNAGVSINPATYSSAYMFARVPGEFYFLGVAPDNKVLLTRLESGITSHTELFKN